MIRLCVQPLVQYWSHSTEQFNWIFFLPSLLRSLFADTHSFIRLARDFLISRFYIVGGGSEVKQFNNIIDRSKSQRHWSLTLTALSLSSSLWLKRNGFFFPSISSDFIISHIFPVFLGSEQESWEPTRNRRVCETAALCSVRDLRNREWKSNYSWCLYQGSLGITTFLPLWVVCSLQRERAARNSDLFWVW